jgi:ABC-2 type transport system ATP-binding protein
MIGRPAELHDLLFAKTLAVTVAATLPSPDAVFSGLPGVQGFSLAEDDTYLLRVTDPAIAAPAVTRALIAVGADLLSIGESRHSLEDVYLQLLDDPSEGSTRGDHS